MTITLNTPYSVYGAGATVDLDNATEAALVAQNRAVYTVNPGSVFFPLTPKEIQELRDSAPSASQSAVAASITGTLTATTLATVTIPAGQIGPNGQVAVEVLWSYTNSANNKTLTVRFGGQSIQTYVVTTTANSRSSHRVSNRNNAASQTAFNAFTTGGFGTSATALLALTVNTAQAVDIVFEAQLSNTGETITLESYQVVVWPKA
jgi:hypothetical protein